MLKVPAEPEVVCVQGCLSDQVVSEEGVAARAIQKRMNLKIAATPNEGAKNHPGS